MAHPWSIDILAKVSLFDGAAALHREEIKTKKYMREMLPRGSSPSVVPLDNLSHLSKDESGQKILLSLNHFGDVVFLLSCKDVMLQ